uniref:Tetratricopeptide repeat protein n=1 Tax=Magnetococcus massalia (strain MO-1) TaxID=451514 RepID=A0A1S7LEV8_MAGMO|nr:Exported protein of unknown function. Containing tetratricopeptide region [Candidatus Magnetococcus massalia]
MSPLVRITLLLTLLSWYAASPLQAEEPSPFAQVMQSRLIQLEKEQKQPNLSPQVAHEISLEKRFVTTALSDLPKAQVRFEDTLIDLVERLKAWGKKVSASGLQSMMLKLQQPDAKQQLNKMLQARKTANNKALLLFTLAELAERYGSYRQSMHFFEQAIHHAPDQDTLYLDGSEVAAILGRRGQAEAWTEKLIELSKRRGGKESIELRNAYLAAGLNQMILKDGAAAEKAFMQAVDLAEKQQENSAAGSDQQLIMIMAQMELVGALELQKRDLEAGLLKAQAVTELEGALANYVPTIAQLLAKQAYKKLDAALVKRLRMMRRHKIDNERIELYYKFSRANALRGQHQFAAALEQYLWVEQKMPRHAVFWRDIDMRYELYSGLAVSLHYSNQLAAALYIYDKLLKLLDRVTIESLDIPYLKAVTQKQLGELTLALGHYKVADEELEAAVQQFLALDEPHLRQLLELRYMQSEAALKQGKRATAQQHVEKALKTHDSIVPVQTPIQVVLQAQLGLLLAEKGEQEQALAYYSHAVKWLKTNKQKPTRVEAAIPLKLAGIMLKQGKLKRVNEISNYALTLIPQELGEGYPLIPQFYTLKGEAALAAGKQERAQGYFNRAIQWLSKHLREDHPEVLRNLKLMTQAQGVIKRGDNPEQLP